MKLTTGLIVVVVSIVIFYLRIAMLRGRKKRYIREFALKRRKIKGRSKGAALPAPEPGSPPFMVSSWWLVGLALVLMLAGIVVYNNFGIFGIDLVKNPAFGESYKFQIVAQGILGYILDHKGFHCNNRRDIQQRDKAR